jgi:hypothetical protein
MEQNRLLTKDEIAEILTSNKSPRIRYTVDLYLLDYIKHCFLEDDQLIKNIEKLETALDHLQKGEVKNGVQDVLDCLKCFKAEYSEYLEDIKILADGDYPSPRGA